MSKQAHESDIDFMEALGFDSNLASELPTISDVDLTTDDVIALSKSDLDFFASISMPTIFKYCFPTVFKSIWAWVLHHLNLTRNFSQLAIGLPRGFGKTIVIKLIILYTILFTKKQFVLIICENEDKAISILTDVSDMLNEPNIIAAFGDWKLGLQIDQRVKKVFGYRGREIILKAAGASTGIRGITEKNRRPDLMIFDDIQSREDSDSELQSDKLEQWMVATAMKAKSPEGCLFLFVANMYPTKGSLLRRLKKNPNWVKFICGGITSDNKSLWEELQPIEQLIREFQNDLASGHPEIFYAEVLNDENATVNNLVDLSGIPDYPFLDDDIPEGRFLIIDPSNDKKASDATAIGCFELRGGLACCVEVMEKIMSPGETIREALTMCLRRGVTLIGIEANAYQYSLLYWFNYMTTQLGITGIEPVELYSGMIPKPSRIMTMFRQLVPSRANVPPEIYLHPSTRALIFSTISQFNPLRRDNTDGVLDLLTYATKMIELYGVSIMNSNVIQEDEFNSIPISFNNSPI